MPYMPVDLENMRDVDPLASPVAGRILVGDGTQWTVVEPGAEESVLAIASGVPAWVEGAGGGGGASLGGGLVLLDEVELTADGAITFANIPAGYHSLRVIGVARTTRANLTDDLSVRVGAGGTPDSGSNYRTSSRSLYGGTTQQEGNAAAAATSGLFYNSMIGDTADANQWAHVDVEFESYDTTGRPRYMFGRLWQYGDDGNIGTARIGFMGASWVNTIDAVDVIEFDSPTATLKAGSSLRMYGVKGGTDVAGLYEQTIGDGTTTAFTIEHGLGSEAVAVAVYDLTGTDPLQVEATVELVDADNVRVTFSTAPGVDEAKVVVVGGVTSEPAGPATATGGDNTYDAGGYRYHEFTKSGTLDVTVGGPVEVLCVGGGSGGNGGLSGVNYGHGGAGGTLREDTVTLRPGSYAAHVGKGGLGEQGTNMTVAGGSSWFAGLVVATGGDQNRARGRTGPGNDDFAGVTHTTSTEGAGGAGAGAAASGKNGGNGAVGFDGNTYGGGGGGGGSTPGTGGSGGGGAGGGVATSATANTGGGGGGTGSGSTPGDGADGIVVIRYPI